MACQCCWTLKKRSKIMGMGLEGVVAAETRLSRVDGEAGRLIVAAHNIEELAAEWRLTDVAALLWRDFDSDLGDGAVVARHLARGRELRVPGSRIALAERVEAAAIAALTARHPDRPPRYQCRILYGPATGRRRPAARTLHPRLRHRPGHRLVRPCHGTGNLRPADPARRTLYRAVAGGCGRPTPRGIGRPDVSTFVSSARKASPRCRR